MPTFFYTDFYFADKGYYPHFLCWKCRICWFSQPFFTNFYPIFVNLYIILSLIVPKLVEIIKILIFMCFVHDFQSLHTVNSLLSPLPFPYINLQYFAAKKTKFFILTGNYYLGNYCCWGVDFRVYIFIWDSFWFLWLTRSVYIVME